MNHLRKKVKPQYKLLYKVFKEQYVYDLLLDISLFLTLIHLKEFLGGIQHCVTVVGKYIFDSNIPSVLPLTCDQRNYCCNSGNETKVMNFYKGVLNTFF